jgi:hypothetical protein
MPVAQAASLPPTEKRGFVTEASGFATSARCTTRETIMAKGQKKNSREAKKPKATKKPALSATDAKRPLTAKFTSLKADK